MRALLLALVLLAFPATAQVSAATMAAQWNTKRLVQYTVASSNSAATYLAPGLAPYATPSNQVCSSSNVNSAPNETSIFIVAGASTSTCRPSTVGSVPAEMTASGYAPTLTMGQSVFANGASTNYRIWTGLRTIAVAFNTLPLVTVNTATAANFVGIVYEPAVDASNYYCCSGDGSNYGCTSIANGFGMASRTWLQMAYPSGGNLTCSVATAGSDGSIGAVFSVTRSTTLPAQNSTPWIWDHAVTTVDASVKNWLWARVAGTLETF
jgi:hypothetical protein